MAATMTAIRTAMRNTLIRDAELVAMLGGPRVYHRYRRQAVDVPSITYYDFSAHPHARMPIVDMDIVLDVWDRLLDDAERKADRVVRLLDVYQAEALGTPPFTVSTGEVNLVAMRFENELDGIADSPDIARKTLHFSLLAFEVAA